MKIIAVLIGFLLSSIPVHSNNHGVPQLDSRVDHPVVAEIDLDSNIGEVIEDTVLTAPITTTPATIVMTARNGYYGNVVKWECVVCCPEDRVKLVNYNYLALPGDWHTEVMQYLGGDCYLFKAGGGTPISWTRGILTLSLISPPTDCGRLEIDMERTRWWTEDGLAHYANNVLHGNICSLPPTDTVPYDSWSTVKDLFR